MVCVQLELAAAETAAQAQVRSGTTVVDGCGELLANRIKEREGAGRL